MNTDLKKIKDKYGEKMMHLCRDLFPTLLENEGLLFNLIESHFQFSKFLYDDLIENQIVEQFKNYIYNLTDTRSTEVVVNKSPKELLKQAGYNLYECKTEEDIQYFKKYYISGEELCTFNGGRLDRCHVFFAVKENIDEIKRENFKKPRREDDYGVSVISIQFSRGKNNTLSIKNRYNHTVNNPDATFSNNLDNIMPGLTNSFVHEYGFKINQNSNGFEIPGYVMANDGRYYKYNYEINNIYYCMNNIIIDNFEVIKEYVEKERYIILDCFILDLKNKELKLYDKTIRDCFVDGFNDINEIKVNKSKENNNKKIYINDNQIEIEIDKLNRITSYSNKTLNKVRYGFLYENEVLTSINLPNVEFIQAHFLYSNNTLQSINLPKVKQIGDDFLNNNTSLISIELPEVKQIGKSFMYSNEILNNINLPKLKRIGFAFLHNNNSLISIDLAHVREIGESFLYRNKSVITIDLPNVKKIGNYFMCSNNSLTSINCPMLEEVGIDFLDSNRSLVNIDISRISSEMINTNTHIKKLLKSKQKVKRR